MPEKLFIASICALWFFQLIKPVYGMYLYPFFIFIRPDQWFEDLGNYRLALITAVILLLSSIIRGVKVKQKYILCACLFIVAAFLSMIFSAEATENSWKCFSDLLKAVCLSLVCLWTIKKRNEFIWFGRWVLLYIAANGAFAFYQIMTKTGLDESGRSRGFMNDQNDTAGLMATSFALAYYLFKNEKNPLIRLFYGICFFCIIFGVFGTVSRGGLITMVFSLVLIYRHNIKNIIAMGLIAVLVAGFLFFAKDLYLARETVTTTMAGKIRFDGSTVKRMDLVETALKIWADNPIWGIGMGNFETAIIDGRRVTRNAHNAYLQILAEMGVIGFMAFLYILRTFFTGLQKITGTDPFYRDMALCFRIIILSWMVFFLFAHSYLHAIFWLALAFPFILEKLAADEMARAPAAGAYTGAAYNRVRRYPA